MSCETCGHTMSRLGCQYSKCAGTWHCPRCGTLQIGHEDGGVDVIVPSLVQRCRSLAAAYIRTDEYPPLTTYWNLLGIAESINTPEGRTQ